MTYSGWERKISWWQKRKGKHGQIPSPKPIPVFRNTMSASCHLHEPGHAQRDRPAAKTHCFISASSGWPSHGGHQKRWGLDIRKRTQPFPKICQALPRESVFKIISSSFSLVWAQVKGAGVCSSPSNKSGFTEVVFKTLFHFRRRTKLKKKNKGQNCDFFLCVTGTLPCVCHQAGIWFTFLHFCFLYGPK